MTERRLEEWNGVARPERVTLEGRYARLEPLEAQLHGASLFEAVGQHEDAHRFHFLFDDPPADCTALTVWIERVSASDDPLFFAVVDRATGKVGGRQSLMRIDSRHGVAEIGGILWGSAIARTRVTTNALFLTASYMFDGLGYRRLEWKCDDGNAASKAAAQRFGFTFEGLFRQHMVIKGRNRDTAWFAMTDGDWRKVKPAYEAWLEPGNFDAEGQQYQSLDVWKVTKRA